MLQQSKRLDYEGPFLYLLVGGSRSMLMDTGATADPVLFPLRRTIDELIGPDFALIVAHTRAHRDHTAADAQFVGRSNTIIVGHSVADVGRFFDITDWPTQEARAKAVRCDLPPRRSPRDSGTSSGSRADVCRRQRTAGRKRGESVERWILA